MANMTRKRFLNNVALYLASAKSDAKCSIKYDKENVRYIAYIDEDDVRIYGRPSSDKLTVRFGSGHQVMVDAVI